MSYSYSLLASIYYREDPRHLKACLDSILASICTDRAEIVLVQDGPISLDLKLVINSFRNSLNIVDVFLPKNLGLGPALNAGLAKCSCDLVGRFDTDDIYPENRFKLQIAEFSADPCLAILGGWIKEFSLDPNISYAEKRVPLDHHEIINFAKGRNPFNHMTVMFRRSIILNLGGYGDEHLFEDYALWVKLISAGYKSRNLPNILAYARAGDDMYSRRGGLSYAKNEALLFFQFYKKNFISLTELVSNLIKRIPVRLLSPKIRSWIYNFYLRGHSFNE